MTFTFACAKRDGDLHVQAFLDKAFLWYLKAMESTEDNSRYLYNLLTEPKGTSGGPRTRMMPQEAMMNMPMDGAKRGDAAARSSR